MSNPKIPNGLQQILDISNRLGIFNDPLNPTGNTPQLTPIPSYDWTNFQDTPTRPYMPGRSRVTNVQNPNLPSVSPMNGTGLNLPDMTPDQVNAHIQSLYPQPRQTDWNKIMGIGMGALSLADHLIPQQKAKAPVVRPMQSYNPSPYGTGSQAIAKDGIHIDPSHKGLFTKEASQHHMGVQEFARQVLEHRNNYSSAEVKRANFARNFGGKKAADGLTLYTGDPEKPVQPGNPAIYHTQAEVDAEDSFLVDFGKRHNLANPTMLHSGKKPGDQKLQTIDLATGQPYDGRYGTMPQNMIKPLPDDITQLYWNPEWQQPYYKDGDTMVYVDKKWWNNPRFLQSREQQDQVIAQRDQKMKNGGKMKGYKCKNGARLMEGKSYDLDHDTINELLNAGFELDFE